MKAVILYCDRCVVEGKPEMRAVHIVWIRTSLGGRTVRLDVCPEHLAVIVGSPNGVPSGVIQERVPRAPSITGKLTRKCYDGIVGYSAKHPRFSLDQLGRFLGKEYHPSRISEALSALVAQRKLERCKMGVYQHPGYEVAEPASRELAAEAVRKLVQHEPGIRGAMVGPLLGISLRLWKPTLEYAREQKLIRSKGVKSGMRLFPV